MSTVAPTSTVVREITVSYSPTVGVTPTVGLVLTVLDGIVSALAINVEATSREVDGLHLLTLRGEFSTEAEGRKAARTVKGATVPLVLPEDKQAYWVQVLYGQPEYAKAEV